MLLLRNFSRLSSGRTSRREIRKLLWEHLFGRFKRVKNNRHGSKIHTHSFLFDDDDEDTERSLATTTAASPYCALTLHSQKRSSYLSRQNSANNYSVHLGRKSSFFTCCGFTVDLSHKPSVDSSNGDIGSRRSTVCKSTANPMNNSPRKGRSYSPKSPSLLSDPHLRARHSVCLRLIEDNNHDSAVDQRRATTIVHCLRHLPPSTISNPLSTVNFDSSFPRRSVDEERKRSTIETSKLNVSEASSMTMAGLEDGMINSTVSAPPNHPDEQSQPPLPAYIVETC